MTTTEVVVVVEGSGLIREATRGTLAAALVVAAGMAMVVHRVAAEVQAK